MNEPMCICGEEPIAMDGVCRDCWLGICLCPDGTHETHKPHFGAGVHSEATKDAAETLWTSLGKPAWKLHVIAEVIQAAEERGRRRGLEAHVRDLHAIENALDEFESDPPTALRVVGEHVGMALHHLRGLAPRDSARCPDGDPHCGCQKPMDAPRDSGKVET